MAPISDRAPDPYSPTINHAPARLSHRTATTGQKVSHLDQIRIMQPEDIQAIRRALANNPAAAGNFQLTTKDNNRWFCKFNDARKYPDLFATETRGLALLAAQNLFRIPKVIASTQMDETQLLVLEYIEGGPRTSAFWRRFGEQLALLHRITQPAFGLGFDNYMGLLPQNNTSTPGWITFFRDRRLQPQLELAADRGLLPGGLLPRFERLFARLPEFFPPEPPALLHGDDVCRLRVL